LTPWHNADQRTGVFCIRTRVRPLDEM